MEEARTNVHRHACLVPSVGIDREVELPWLFVAVGISEVPADVHLYADGQRAWTSEADTIGHLTTRQDARDGK